jgi:galactokinase
MTVDVHGELETRFASYYGEHPDVCAYAPGRVEILGNHTDYNEGFVLSAAINMGTYFMAAAVPGNTCRIVAGDLMEEVTFPLDDASPSREHQWANYPVGVASGLAMQAHAGSGFNGMFLSSVPLASGLSSSAALEISTGLALSRLYGISIDPLRMAKIAQAAEHVFAGVRCGLLDQISSLFGRRNALVHTDFRSLEVSTVPVDRNARFLVCNTGVKHTLVESEYNERRACCEAAADFFADALDRAVVALRDVSWAEWMMLSGKMKPVVAKRAAHVIGENARVVKGRQFLADGQIEEFGRLMFESHESSRTYFENSCPELDLIVDTAHNLRGVCGARLSGGGFGGSAVVLAAGDTEGIAAEISDKYGCVFGTPCQVRTITASDGARIIGG